MRRGGREDGGQLSNEEGPLWCSRDAKNDDMDTARWHHVIGMTMTMIKMMIVLMVGRLSMCLVDIDGCRRCCTDSVWVLVHCSTAAAVRTVTATWLISLISLGSRNNFRAGWCGGSVAMCGVEWGRAVGRRVGLTV